MNKFLLSTAAFALCCGTAYAGPQDLPKLSSPAVPTTQPSWVFTSVPIINQGASTYYVSGHIHGIGEMPMLVDTGSGYSAMDKNSVDKLRKLGLAHYVKRLRGVMADGSKKIMPVYRISGISLGGHCFVGDVEVAVFPRKTRMILGLNALRKLAPFAFSLDENRAELMLSNCQSAPEAVSGRIARNG